MYSFINFDVSLFPFEFTPPYLPVTTTDVLFCQCRFVAFSQVLYKWNHTVCSLLFAFFHLV